MRLKRKSRNTAQALFILWRFQVPSFRLLTMDLFWFFTAAITRLQSGCLYGSADLGGDCAIARDILEPYVARSFPLGKMSG